MYYILLFFLLILVLISIHYYQVLNNKAKLLINPNLIILSTNIIRFICSLLKLNSLIMFYYANEKYKLLKIENKSNEFKNGICFYGDSLFTFWFDIKKSIKTQTNIFNSSFGGSTSYDLLLNIYKLCINFKPKIIFIHTGGNDYDTNIFLNNNQLIKNVINNIKNIINICNNYNIKVIILLSPFAKNFTNKKKIYQIKLYNNIKKLPNCEILDITNYKFKIKSYKFDNLHLNNLGYYELGYLINNFIKKNIKFII
tara:strand:- start:990 stop:1754 length:765 start_codon:yes stop_codon:yes gene_type:complete